MRSEFVETFYKLAIKDPKVVFLTGDLGFNAFEKLRDDLGERFINAGVAEHNMVTVAAGLAYAGFKPWIYSIAPFVSIKVLEELRNDVALTGANVKIVALGGGYDYALAGPTHHALSDVAVILTLPDIKVYAPGFAEDVEEVVKIIYKKDGPAYLRMTRSEEVKAKIPAYSPCRRILNGDKITVIAFGSIVTKVIDACINTGGVDLWLITELPFDLPSSLIQSIKKTRAICIVEEHVKTGGLGHFLSHAVAEEKMTQKKFIHLCAKGYISKKYGSRDFYLKESGLDSENIADSLRSLL